MLGAAVRDPKFIALEAGGPVESEGAQKSQEKEMIVCMYFLNKNQRF